VARDGVPQGVVPGRLLKAFSICWDGNCKQWPSILSTFYEGSAHVAHMQHASSMGGKGLLLQWLASLVSLTECGALGGIAVLQVRTTIATLRPSCKMTCNHSIFGGCDGGPSRNLSCTLLTPPHCSQRGNQVCMDNHERCRTRASCCNLCLIDLHTSVCNKLKPSLSLRVKV